MRLSRKADYALRVLFALVERSGTGPVPMNLLAKENDVPKRFLEHIMLDLKSQGWVASLPGRKGGYSLAISPEDLTMGQVVRHFDGQMVPIGCVSITRNEPCSQAAHCRFRRVLLEIRNFTAHLMDNATLAQIAQKPLVREHEVFTLGVDGI